MFLEERMNGSPLDDVVDQYKKEVPDNLAKDLRTAAAAGNMDLGKLLPVLRDFLTQQLTEYHPGWGLEMSLKELLEYGGSDIDEEEWWDDHFPDDLEVQHTFYTYELLEKHSRGE
jgi:hypothetical protein